MGVLMVVGAKESAYSHLAKPKIYGTLEIT